MARRIKYYSLREIRRRGKSDGRDWRWKPWRPFPGWPLWEPKEPTPALVQEGPSEFEKELLESAEENISIVQEWTEKDTRLHNACADTEDRYKIARDAVDRENIEHKDALKEYEEAMEMYNNLPKPLLSGWKYWLPLMVITVTEVLFNGLVFLIFGQSRVHTYIMALGVIIALPVSTYFIGRFLRMEKKTATSRGLAILSGVVVFITLGALQQGHTRSNI